MILPTHSTLTGCRGFHIHWSSLQGCSSRWRFKTSRLGDTQWYLDSVFKDLWSLTPQNFNRYERSLSWPSPSLDHSSLTSWGKRDKIRGVRMTSYWVPQIPRASRERVCDCKSSLSFHKFATEHLFITGIFNSVCMWVKIIRSLRPNRSVSIWRADW